MHTVKVSGSKPITRSQADFRALETGSYLLRTELAFPSGETAQWSTSILHLAPDWDGRLAARARVKQFSVFHFSPRYTGEEAALREEAQMAYQKQMAEVRGRKSEVRGFS